MERERLQQVFENACINASEIALKLSDPENAVRFGMRVIEVNPYLETGYQILFKAHSSLGNKALIVKLFNQLESVLQKDLSTSPAMETIALYKSLV